MTHGARWTLRAVVCISVLVAISSVGVWWVTNTKAGAKWGFERLGAFFPGRLDVRDMEGPLKSPFKVRHFSYKSDRLSINADSVVVVWNLRKLLARRLDIHQLHAKNVEVLVGAPGTTPEAVDSLTGLPDLNLPVNVIMRDGLLDGVRITTPGNDSALVLDRIAIDARSTRHDSLYVNHLTVRSKPLDIDFAGVAFPRHGYAVRLRGAWDYRAPGWPALHGSGTLGGNMDTLLVLQNLSGPFDAQVSLKVVRPFRALDYRGNVAFSKLHPREFFEQSPAGMFHGTIQLAGNFDRMTTSGTVAGATDAVGPVAADFQMRRDHQLWNLDRLRVTRSGSSAVFEANGTLSADTTITHFDLDTRWTTLDWPLQGEPWARSDRGTARLQGTPNDFGIKLEALLAGRNLPPGRWTLDGRGGNGRLAIRTVIADILDGRIVGSGNVTWNPDMRWNLRFDGKGIHPDKVAPQYPGAIDFAGQSEGVMERGGPSGRILVSRLTGTIRNQIVSAVGTLSARQGEYNVSGASLQWGPNRAEAEGGFGKHWSLNWKLQMPRVGAVLAQGGGSLQGQGTIQGPQKTPRITGTITGDSLFVGELHAGALRADGDVDLAPGGAIRLDASATQIDAGTYSAQHFLLNASGTRDQNVLRASLATRLDSTMTLLAGGFGHDGWRGEVRQFDLIHHRAGRWSLAAPARLSASPSHVSIEDFRWGSGPSRITWNANWERQGPWRTDAQFDQVDLGLITPFLPPRIELQGPMRGHVVAHGVADGPVFADVDLVPGPGQVLHQTAAGDWVSTPFTNAELRASADGNRGNASFGADLVNAGTVRGTLDFPAPASGAPRAIHGTLALHMTDLGVFQGFTTEVDSTAGSMDADLTIDGTADHPSLYGPVTIRNASANVPRLGVQLRDMKVTATGTAAGHLAVHGTVRSGTGTLTIDGTAAIGPGASPEANLTLSGTRVQALNSEDAQLIASPNLTFKLKGNRADLTGTVTVPQGKLDLGEGDSKRLVKPSQDVVYAGADTLEKGPIEMHTDVRVILGDQVRVSGYGLDGRVEGTILAQDAPGLPTLATGTLQIKDGTYQIYGQELTVDTGSLVFGGGPITNPAVAARATRKADDGTVAGFLVSGTVMKPDVHVFAEPAMDESEAMSYVLFGKAIEQANLSQGQMASTMTTALGVPGTNILAHGIASQLGIEKAQVQVGSSFESTSIALGTHLSPKFYLGAGVDVFQATPTVEFRYILNHLFTIEAATARANRVDLLYTIER